MDQSEGNEKCNDTLESSWYSELCSSSSSRNVQSQDADDNDSDITVTEESFDVVPNFKQNKLETDTIQVTSISSQYCVKNNKSDEENQLQNHNEFVREKRTIKDKMRIGNWQDKVRGTPFRPSRSVANQNLKDSGLDQRYDNCSSLDEFFNYLIADGKQRSYSQKVTNSVNRFLYWCANGQEFNWQYLADTQLINKYASILTDEVKLFTSSIYNIVFSLKRAREYAIKMGMIEQLDQSEHDIVNNLLDSYKSDKQKRCREIRLSDKGDYYLNPITLFKLVNRRDNRLRYDMISKWALKCNPTPGWQSVEYQGYTFALRYTIVQVLIWCKARLIALCNMTFDDIEAAKTDWLDQDQEVTITVYDHDVNDYNAIYITLTGYPKVVFYNFWRYVRRCLPKIVEGDESYVFLNCRGRRLTTSKANEHVEFFFAECGLPKINTSRLVKSLNRALQPEFFYQLKTKNWQKLDDLLRVQDYT
ncbi:uncharacterized protein TRIADDRAFT_57589 [Trichoplax adhaerens]|uniref:Uncharacterized protein n=1 Tax=Trichoplax adhaerens TaxID=10228 RepID=B3RZV2_TRIAD|nr:predicted protein [Trichoplax adhaerens]EDV24269.1 predicted protein [Trichoplax adhaerens]|eukprot:XP_002113795.1 predicted protein [Trichoplax adhaerens]